jgi:four helix bundle protein
MPPYDIRERVTGFAIGVVRLSMLLRKGGAEAKTISMQLLRSSTSIGANLEEAYGTSTEADFKSKLTISLKEARETLYWLRILSGAELVREPRIGLLVTEANEIVAILTSIAKQVSPGPRR